jgi:hypothetical protein
LFYYSPFFKIYSLVCEIFIYIDVFLVVGKSSLLDLPEKRHFPPKCKELIPKPNNYFFEPRFEIINRDSYQESSSEILMDKGTNWFLDMLEIFRK